MTISHAAARPGDAGGLILAGLRLHPLVAIVLLAAVLRLPLAFWPNFQHPDEVFQYLEPAWRILGHEGIVSWEWRYGMRSWLLPMLMAGPVALGDWLAPGGTGAFIVPRLIAALASLSIVISAWVFGARISRTHALIAAFVAAIWFEFVYFAPHTLGEPLATAIILPAALLVTRTPPSRRELIAGGALLALATLFRFQYAPAIAVLGIGACWRRWSQLLPMTLGGAAVLAASALFDAAYGTIPFGWLVTNIEQNLLHDRAASFGVTPAITYFIAIWSMWSLATVPLTLAIFRGQRRAPLLLWVALVNLAFHSLIGHKEYRFMFLSIVLLIILAALGSVDWIQALRHKPSWRRPAVPLIAGGWVAISAMLAATGTMPMYWMRGVGGARLAADLRADGQMCGLALYGVPFYLLPGRDRLVGSVPLFALYSTDPLISGNLAKIAPAASAAFNRILAPRSAAKELPADFTPRRCETVGSAEVCVFVRDGACNANAASLFTINDVLARIDL